MCCHCTPSIVLTSKVLKFEKQVKKQISALLYKLLLFCIFYNKHCFYSCFVFIFLCLLSMFQIRFFKNNSLFPNLLCSLLCLAPAVSITVPFLSDFSTIIDFEVHIGQITKILVVTVYQIIQADRYITALYAIHRF